MSKIRLALLCVLAVSGVSAISTSSASAACCLWLVAGNPLVNKVEEGTGEKKVAAKKELVEARAETGGFTLTGKPNGTEIVVLCGSIKPLLGFITEAVEDKALDETTEKLIFTECKIDTPATCSTTNEISVEPLDSELFVDLDPETKKEEIYDEWGALNETKLFATVPVTGCAAEGSFKVTGETCALVLEAETAAEIHLMEFVTDPLAETETLCLLKFGINPATFTGEFEFLLDGAKEDALWAANKV